MSADMATATMIEAGNSLAEHDVRADLAAVDVPTVVVVGDVDRLTPPGHAREIARIVPGASLTVLPGIGHQVMQEHPAAVVDAVEELARRSTVVLDA
jgi:pimeloyl-ACP methyl ester carboxylesterase